MREIDDIIIHCTATPAGRPHTVEDVRQWHRQRGWQDIGYHYLVYLDGSIHRGRPEEQEGAHCYGHNAHSIGVAYVGGLSQDGKTPEDTRTPAQRDGLLRLVRNLKSRYPDAGVHGHNEYAAKAGPCYDVRQWVIDNDI